MILKEKLNRLLRIRGDAIRVGMARRKQTPVSWTAIDVVFHFRLVEIRDAEHVR
jgi:hypothetical protein